MMNNKNLSRRSFLQVSAAAGLSALATNRFLNAAEPQKEFGGLTIGMQSYTLRSMPFDKALEAMSTELNIHQTEVFPGHYAALSPPQVLAKLKAADVTMVSYGVVPFGNNEDQNRKLFEYAKAMGLTNLTCDPSPDAFDNLDKLTEEYKITAAIHDHGPGHRWGKIDTIHEAIKDHSKMIGLCNDTGHFIRNGEDPLRACDVFKDRMYAMHLKDFKKTANGGFEDCVLGDGSFPTEKMMKWLLDNKFAGYLLIEYEGGDPVNASKKSMERLAAAVKPA